MAEGLAKHYLKSFIIKSAGTKPEPINYYAIQVMKEIDIDISNQYSKSISIDEIKTFDIAITLCGDAQDKCRNLNDLVKQCFHWDIIDPAKTNGTSEKKFTIFRNVRDQIKNKISTISKKLN